MRIPIQLYVSTDIHNNWERRGETSIRRQPPSTSLLLHQGCPTFLNRGPTLSSQQVFLTFCLCEGFKLTSNSNRNRNFNQFSNFPLFRKENLIQFYLTISENFKGGGSWRGGAIVNKSRQSNSETLDAYISKTVLHKTILFSVKICNRGRAARWHIGQQGISTHITENILSNTPNSIIILGNNFSR